jgi:CBS domain containing-hemolysin-like protein
LPLVDPDSEGGSVVGYLLQLDFLGAILEGDEAPELAGLVRPLVALSPDVTLDRALARLRAAGQRMALVGTPQAPVGLVTLKDLVRTISGELGDW